MRSTLRRTQRIPQLQNFEDFVSWMLSVSGVRCSGQAPRISELSCGAALLGSLAQLQKVQLAISIKVIGLQIGDYLLQRKQLSLKRTAHCEVICDSTQVQLTPTS